MSGATLERRLANYRATLATVAREPGDRVDGGVGRGSIELGRRLAEALDGELLLDPSGPVVRVEPATIVLPIDRSRLASLPGLPPPDVPLVCLDTETTGLATASGTVAFLVGLGWWEADRFRQVQLLLPDHPAEPGLLARLAAHIPAAAWLVTYNGRGFDWPLLVARYRMVRSAPPPLAGHLDLLPFVRRVFRHRMTDARLRTVETELLGSVRHGDVDGWQIPGLFLDFLRGAPAEPLIDVVRHNREDVRSLGRLLARVDLDYADETARSRAPRGDLAGLARAFARDRRLDEALGCLDAALAAEAPPAGVPADDDGEDSIAGGSLVASPPGRRHRWLATPSRVDASRRGPARLPVDGGACHDRARPTPSSDGTVRRGSGGLAGARDRRRSHRGARVDRDREASRASVGGSRRCDRCDDPCRGGRRASTATRDGGSARGAGGPRSARPPTAASGRRPSSARIGNARSASRQRPAGASGSGIIASVTRCSSS